MIDLDVITMPLVFIDVETTGLSPQKCRITEIAAIRVENGEVVKKVVSLFNVGEPLPEFIVGLTGITDDMLKDAPLFETVATELDELLEGALFVAHNAKFDYSFIKAEYERCGRQFSAITLCTVELARVFHPQWINHKLQTMIEQFKFDFTERHRAEDDASVLIQYIKQLRVDVGDELLRETSKRVLV